MAHINTTGRHVNLYLDSPVVLGLGRSNTYPMQEGAFFGNIFVSPPQGFYCNGYDSDRGPAAGRIGANQVGSPYHNPFGGAGRCQDNCSVVGANSEAFGSCNGYNNVITVFRDFDPALPYTICNQSSGMCLDVKGNSTSAGAVIDMYPANGGMNQKWVFERVNTNSHDGNYRIRSASSNLYLDVVGSSKAAGGVVDQAMNTGTTNQMWNMIQIVAGSYLMENENSRLLLNTDGIPQGGQIVQNGSGSYDDSQMWKLTLVDPTGGAAAPTTSDPCSSYCSPATQLPTQNWNTGNLGTAATCYSTTFPITTMNCGNMTGRTLSVNGTAVNCSSPTLPAKVNGGYCFAAPILRRLGVANGREPDRGADTGLEDGVGLGAVWGRAGELQRPGEEPQEGRRVRAAHLLALP